MSAVVVSFDPAPAAFCAAWHARYFEAEPVHGGRCCWCNRDVAVPASARGKRVGCIYCGMDRGFVEMVEREPDYHTGVRA